MDTELAVALIATAVFLFLVIYFNKRIRRAIEEAQKLTFKAAGFEFSVTKDEAIRLLVAAIDESLKNLSDDERRLFHAIRNADGNVTPDQIHRKVFKGTPFIRHKPHHECFRSLRSRNLIRPREHNEWRDDKHPVVTEFGKLILKYRPQAIPR